ncbi:aromatic motif membrane protein [[Mycoplasma] imitans]|uniref:aromatic motif membrane protein n=1 Tax=[Mycoplasma] imitans TaxID=29560 RepID=UPI0004881714|nr:aromatic motif membrane protein [[Mycoplasma] imitans]
MKKSLINKIVVFIASFSIFPGLLLSSCVNEKKPKDQSEVTIKLKQKQPLIANEMFVENYLNQIQPDKKLADLYKITQLTIPNAFYDELKAALITASPSNINVLSKSGSENSLQVTNSINAIKNTLTKNWFWYLWNINQNIYVLNYFNDDYTDIKGNEETPDNPKNTKSLFDYVQEKYKSYAYNLKNLTFEGIKTFELSNQKHDVYTVKTANYLKLGTDAFIVFFRYKQDNKEEILFTPDVFVKNVENLDLDALINAFNTSFISAYENVIKQITNYYTVLEEENPEDLAYKQHADNVLLSLYTRNNYASIFNRALDLVNNDQLKLLRYTWGEINEIKN